MRRIVYTLIFLIPLLNFSGCNHAEDKTKTSEEIQSEGQKGQPIEEKDKQIPSKLMTKKSHTKLSEKKKEIKVTFIELGATKCIPCKMMQPIMKEIEQEYGDEVKVVFYDVWTGTGSPYAEKYKIRLIPTQVFLDKNGNEYFRHEGFFPKGELIKILEMQGVQK